MAELIADDLTRADEPRFAGNGELGLTRQHDKYLVAEIVGMAVGHFARLEAHDS